MKDWTSFVKDFASRMGLEDYTVDIDAEHGHGHFYIHDHPTAIKENLAALVESVNHILQLVAHKENERPLFLDINNYRKERENLIVELAKATARKVVATKEEIPLPAMNSYERRLAHLELAAHPEVVTESVGKGKNRYVVVRPVGAAPAGAVDSPLTTDHAQNGE